MSNEVFIDGDADAIQLRVQGHTTQTNPLQTWEDSSANVLAQVDANGQVLIDGQQDQVQLRVQAHSTQTDPLQTWEKSDGTSLAQITGDGRLELGDLDLGTPDALIEANRDITLPSSVLQRGVQSRGLIRGAIGNAIAWAVHELELLGDGGVSGLHAALRAKISQKNTGDSDLADLRAGDFEAIVEGGNSAKRVGEAVGVHSSVTNEQTGHLDKAVGVKVTIHDEGIDPIQNAYGLLIEDVDQGAQANYAIHTGEGSVHVGDDLEVKVFADPPTEDPPSGFIKVYPKLDTGNPKLYAKDSVGVEHELGGGGGASQLSDLSDVNTSIPTAGNILRADGVDWESVPAADYVFVKGANGELTVEATAVEAAIIESSAWPTILTVNAYGTGYAAYPAIQLARSRGTKTNPEGTQSEDMLGALWASGRDTDPTGAAGIYFDQEGPAGPNNIPGRIRFMTGNGLFMYERFRVDSLGRVGINVWGLNAQLTVRSGDPTRIASITRAADNQTANVRETQDFTGGLLEGVDKNGAVIQKELSTAPTSPTSGYRKLYPKSDGWYGLNSSGQETKLSTGSPDAQYVTLATDGTLSQERVLTAGNGLSLADGGAGGNVTLDVNVDNATLEIAADVLQAQNDVAQWNANQLQGHNVASTAPSEGQALIWDNANSQWEPGDVSSGGGNAPTGAMLMWPANTPPTDWLLCYGQAVSRTTYANLFNVIGTTFGAGDGTTTFNLPDLRGRFPLGQDDMGGTSANRVTGTAADSIGGNSGAENHTLTTSQLPAHNHAENYVSGVSQAPAFLWNVGTPRNSIMSSGSGNGNGTRLTTDNTGSGGAHNNMPPYLTLNYIIKT